MDVELLKMLAADPLFEGVSAQQIEDMSTFSQEVGKLHLRLKRYKKGRGGLLGGRGHLELRAGEVGADNH